MKNLNKALLATAVSAALSTTAYAEESKGFIESIADGKASVLLRYRIETNEQDNALKDAFASTLKTRVTYKSGAYKGFSGVLEFDSVNTVLFDEDFNAGGRDGDPSRSVVADPEVTDLNESYVQYSANGFTGKYGRQRIVLDNQRFFGGVAWRQSEQTFDAISGTYKTGGLTATYAHITNRKNIFNELNDVKDDILNVKYKVSDAAVVTGYVYLLENENGTGEQDTIGASLTGKASLFTYRAELAQQEGANYDALYAHVAGTVKAGPVKLGLGYESIGSDDGNGAVGFKYGTNHAFNGWSDIFLGGAGPNGLNDTYASISGKAGPVALSAIYHSYESDFASTDLGSEINLVAKTKAGPVGLLFKFADYSASDDAGRPDTQKIWLMSTLKF